MSEPTDVRGDADQAVAGGTMSATVDAPTLVADEPVIEPDPGPTLAELAARARWELWTRRLVDLAVVAACVVFVFANLHPSHILSSAVPAGGDMGAHVWGPAYLRDHLLPDLRISGWTPDWYAGFPAYQFYMVIPSLLIVALDVGLFGGWTMLLPLAAAAALGVAAARVGPRGRRGVRWWLVAAAVAVAVLGMELPYGTAFKLITVSGLLSLPLAAYAMGRLADLAFPGPALLAVATLPFLFDRNFTIYGGNAASTLAGEFAFSISLSLSLLYLGVVIRGLRTGRHRALAAVLLALTGLCHLIPAFFALAATAVIALGRVAPALAPAAVGAVRDSRSKPWLSGGDSLPTAVRLPYRVLQVLARLIARLVALPVRIAWRTVRRSSSTLRWLAAVLPVGGLISAFWVLPFVWQRAYVNDMGWEKLPHPNSGPDEDIWKYLIPRREVEMVQDIRWVLALAAIGVVLSLAFRIRLGWVLSALVLLAAVAFVVVPQGRLWNARLLPFYYLSLYLLAAVGVSEVGRTLAVLAARDPERPGMSFPVATAGVGLVGALLFVALPLRTIPFASTKADGSYTVLGLRNDAGDESFVRSWARWNFTGYEGKDAYREYRELVTTMTDVGEEHGCGRAFWEYEKDLNRYGTPMALMLLPHWTDGCIGSMEGLFFEASATTPFHFLTQVELSAAPSAAQRDLPYDGFDIDDGVRHLQLLGARYYLATSVQATEAARRHPDLTEVAASGPWVVFEVAGSELVEALGAEPAVLDDVSDAQHDWICRTKDENDRCAGPAVEWFTNPDRWDVLLASSGPDRWQEVDADDSQPESRAVEPAVVSGIETDTDRIAFDVDRPGTPVLVKASYFPNWRASGADGPYRVAPNLMVVVPTADHVELTYGREPIEWLAYAATAVGIALAVLLALRPPLLVGPRRRPAHAAHDAAEWEP